MHRITLPSRRVHPPPEGAEPRQGHLLLVGILWGWCLRARLACARTLRANGSATQLHCHRAEEERPGLAARHWARVVMAKDPLPNRDDLQAFGHTMSPPANRLQLEDNISLHGG